MKISGWQQWRKASLQWNQWISSQSSIYIGGVIIQISSTWPYLLSTMLEQIVCNVTIRSRDRCPPNRVAHTKNIKTYTRIPCWEPKQFKPSFRKSNLIILEIIFSASIPKVGQSHNPKFTQPTNRLIGSTASSLCPIPPAT